MLLHEFPINIRYREIRTADILAPALRASVGGKIVILSPTLDIMRQTFEEAQQFAPELKVTNWSGREQRVSELAEASVINTTYQSIDYLLDKGLLKEEDIRMVIADEMHTAIGSERYKIFRRMPNAIFLGTTATPEFSRLDELIQQGEVDPNERWVGMFRNNSYELSLEEAMLDRVISPANLYMLETHVPAESIRITPSGEYNQQQLERFVRQSSRNYHALAAVAGVDAVLKRFPHAHFPKATEDKLREYHTQFKGLKTVIFGASIKHVLELEQHLQELGIKAKAVYGEMGSTMRKSIFDRYEHSDELQVLLGINLIRLGWNSPATEVGIFLTPTRSWTDITQEFGRLLRLKRDNPNKRAQALQLVDRFPRFKPVLLTQIFSREMITNAGYQRNTSQEDQKESTERKIRQRLPVVIDGMDIETIFTEMPTEALTSRNLARITDIAELDKQLEAVIALVMQDNTDLPLLGQYRALADTLPEAVPVTAQNLALVAAREGNPQGKKALALLNFKTILRALEPYLEDLEAEDLLQNAIITVMERLSETQSQLRITHVIQGLVRNHTDRYIADRENVPVNWIASGKYKTIRNVIETSLQTTPEPTIDQIEVWAARNAENTELPINAVRSYILRRLLNVSIDFGITAETLGEESPRSNIMEMNKKLNEVLDSEQINDRERQAIRLYFGLGRSPEENMSEQTYEEVGSQLINAQTGELGVTKERV